MAAKRVYVVGTADTKGAELAFLAAEVAATGARPLTIDVGTRAATVVTDVAASAVARCHPAGPDAVLAGSDRGVAVTAMGEAFRRFIASRDDIAGIIGIGGGGGTSIIAAGMRELPVGLPKLMVSTLASGDVGPYVGVSDIMMMSSVTDIAGLNRISRAVLRNAAHAIAGAAAGARTELEGKPSIGLTMFGVTTTGVMATVEHLKADYDCLVFHATGTGGRAMEKLADSGMLVGLVDVTTTEVCDLLFDGVLSAGPDRLGAVARTGVPYVGSVGALDMVNFWAPATIPEKFSGRLFHRHNPNVTLMRTTPAENAATGRWIGEKLNLCEGPVRFLLPEKGVSALDKEGEAFFDPAADAALFSALADTIVETADRRLIRLPFHINDPEFSAALARTFREIAA